MRAVIYIRVSTKEQAEEGYSLQAQREACMKYLDEHGWTFVNEYQDAGESARTANRPAFQKMLSEMVDDGVNALVIHKLDRLARNIEDHAAVRARLRGAGVELVSVTENLESTASGKLVEGILASLSEWYSNNLSTEVKKGLNAKVKAGGYPGSAPLGYLNVREEANGRNEAVIVPDPKLAPLIEEAFRLYATDQYCLREVHEEMHRRGLPASRSGIERLLHNPIYTGRILWKEVMYEGKHEPIVSLDLFNKVQTILSKNSTAGSHSWKYAHHLKGFLTCGTCGAGMSYMLVKQKKHGYFYCLGKHRRRTECEEPYVAVESIEAQIEELFRGIRIPEEFHRKIVEEIEAEIASRETDRAGSAKFLSKRLEALSKKREKLLELWYQEAIDLVKFKSEQEKIDEQMKAVSRELDVQTDELHETRDILDIAVKLAKNVGRSFEKATPDVKKLWLEACFREIQVSGKEISSFAYREPFDRLVAIDGGSSPTTGSNSTAWLARQCSNRL